MKKTSKIPNQNKASMKTSLREEKPAWNNLHYAVQHTALDIFRFAVFFTLINRKSLDVMILQVFNYDKLKHYNY